MERSKRTRPLIPVTRPVPRTATIPQPGPACPRTKTQTLVSAMATAKSLNTHPAQKHHDAAVFQREPPAQGKSMKPSKGEIHSKDQVQEWQTDPTETETDLGRQVRPFLKLMPAWPKPSTPSRTIPMKSGQEQSNPRSESWFASFCKTTAQ